MAWEFNVDGRIAHAANGSRENNPDDPVVILIHGAGLDRTIWQMQTRNIAFQGRRVFAVDLPGHGYSNGPLLPTIEEMAEAAQTSTNQNGLSPNWLLMRMNVGTRIWA